MISRDNIEYLKATLIPDYDQDMSRQTTIIQQISNLEKKLEVVQERLDNRETTITALMAIECPEFHIDPVFFDTETIKAHIKDI